jgi:cytoskeletal protein CcmA (bactofilin family)
MAETEQFFQKTRGYVERMWQGVRSGTLAQNDQSDDVLQPLVNRKEQNMLKLGTREEKDVTNATGHGHGLDSLNTRSASAMETVIGENITIEGTVRANEDIIMDGRIKGTIETKSHRITIGPKAQIEADVNAEDVVISGRMTGNIIARNKVQINKDADFTGSIKAKRIAIEDGAYIKATLELEKQERPTVKTADAIIFEKSLNVKKTSDGKPQSA